MPDYSVESRIATSVLRLNITCPVLQHSHPSPVAQQLYRPMTLATPPTAQNAATTAANPVILRPSAQNSIAAPFATTAAAIHIAASTTAMPKTMNLCSEERKRVARATVEVVEETAIRYADAGRESAA